VRDILEEQEEPEEEEEADIKLSSSNEEKWIEVEFLLPFEGLRMHALCVTGNVRRAHSAAFLPENPSFDYLLL
jgi:hypothetical protein